MLICNKLNYVGICASFEYTWGILFYFELSKAFFKCIKEYVATNLTLS